MSSLLSAAERFELAAGAMDAAALASEAIREMYNSSQPLVVEKKADRSPVTKADKCAHDIICRALLTLPRRWPVLSEETHIPPFSERSRWSCYWLVDPLDGTREFIERTGEFTINIALIENGTPTMGVVYLPLQRDAYCGVVGQQAWLDNANGKKVLNVTDYHQGDSIRVLTSRRHSGKQLETCLSQLDNQFPRVERICEGSALKFCRLAEGNGDIYPRFSPCSEWDTAAGQAVLEASGGCLLDMQFNPLRYNQRESLLNPNFYALAAPNINWSVVLTG